MAPATKNKPAAASRAAAGKPVNKSGFPDPKLPACPNCKIGVLYVVAWDPDATHENGQPIYAPRELSGGAVVAGCLNCGHRESHPMDPQEAPVDPRSGA